MKPTTAPNRCETTSNVSLRCLFLHSLTGFYRLLEGGQKANQIFLPVLESASKAQKLRATLTIFERSRFFFNLPTFIMESIDLVRHPWPTHLFFLTCISTGKIWPCYSRLQKGEIHPRKSPWPIVTHWSNERRRGFPLWTTTAETNSEQGLGNCWESDGEYEESSCHSIGRPEQECRWAREESGVGPILFAWCAR